MFHVRGHLAVQSGEEPLLHLKGLRRRGHGNLAPECDIPIGALEPRRLYRAPGATRGIAPRHRGVTWAHRRRRSRRSRLSRWWIRPGSRNADAASVVNDVQNRPAPWIGRERRGERDRHGQLDAGRRADREVPRCVAARSRLSVATWGEGQTRGHRLSLIAARHQLPTLKRCAVKLGGPRPHRTARSGGQDALMAVAVREIEDAVGDEP